MMGLSEKIVLIHESLSAANVPHAFGGALALAWCTQRARGTIDIDINIFVTTDESQHVFNSLPSDVSWSTEDLKVVIRDGQVRLWWEQVPLDIFLNTTELHSQMAKRCRWELFMGKSIPFLSCLDLALFKVFFNTMNSLAIALQIRIKEIYLKLGSQITSSSQQCSK